MQVTISDIQLLRMLFCSVIQNLEPQPAKSQHVALFFVIFNAFSFFPIGLRGEVEWCFYRPKSLNSKVRHFHGILGYFDRRRLYLVHVDRCKSQWPCWFGRVCERLHAVSWKKENSSKRASWLGGNFFRQNVQKGQTNKQTNKQTNLKA